MDRLEEVYRGQHDRLWRSLLAYTGNSDLASEAVAETFSQAVARGDAIRDPAAWVWRSAFRIAGGLMAERGSAAGGAAFDDLAPLATSGYDGRGNELDTSLAEFLDQLGGLSDQQRAVVVLRYAGGFQPADIAELLGTTAGTVRVQLHRAHAHLRERIKRNDLR